MSVAPRVVFCAAKATPPIFLAISPVPLAASATLRAISLVVTVCSSTAEAMLLEMSLIWLMMALISPMACTAPLVSVWMASIFWPISSVALAVSLASSLTSLATTAKPLPASPARAASIVAFSASRLVCCAMEVAALTGIIVGWAGGPAGSHADSWAAMAASLWLMGTGLWLLGPTLHELMEGSVDPAL